MLQHSRQANAIDASEAEGAGADAAGAAVAGAAAGESALADKSAVAATQLTSLTASFTGADAVVAAMLAAAGAATCAAADAATCAAASARGLLPTALADAEWFAMGGYDGCLCVLDQAADVASA